MSCLGSSSSMYALSCTCATTKRNTSTSPLSMHCWRKTSKFETFGPVKVQTFVRKAAFATLLTAATSFCSSTRLETSTSAARPATSASLPTPPSKSSEPVLMRGRQLQHPAKALAEAASPSSPSSCKPRLLRASAMSCCIPGQRRSCGVDMRAGWQGELAPASSRLGISRPRARQTCARTGAVSSRLSGTKTACFSPGTPAIVKRA
mmetsp:Transcript_3930/g.10789  ORF Transcript_3930/g.10789 Transcript_3930/m.10789 type:complete len:206 (-) Transcript_3930:172-789(-)